MPGMIKCVTLYQPWATFVALGAKRYETRHWHHDYTGPIAIHAAKTQEQMVLCYEEPFRSILEDLGISPPFTPHIPFGAIVAIGEVTEYYKTFGTLTRLADGKEISDREYDLGDYSPGRFAWCLENVRALPEPIPYKGAQGFFEVPVDLISSSILGVH